MPEDAPDIELAAAPDDGDGIRVVDDQKSVSELIVRYLTRHGYRVSTASGGTEALRLVGERPPAAVFTDIQMPDMDGMTLLARLIRLDPDMIVVMTTGAPNMQLTIEALRAGASDFLPKPVRLPQLLKSLQEGIARRQARLASYQRQIWLEERVRDRTEELTAALDALRKLNQQLTEAYDGSIEMLRRTSAMRDNDTGAHIDRIRLFSEIIARRVELPEDQIRILRAASPMQDIGKIGIPDSILQKRGKLTPEEYELMKEHTLIGAEILSGYEVPVLEASARIALTHHERWDGSGYPRGLSGTEIPLFGLIVATVDVWDALTHERC